MVDAVDSIEKKMVEIEKRVVCCGQRYINQLIILTEKRMNGIREESAEISGIDTFMLFGNPDLDFVINFARIWKKKASKGKNSKIVLVGGIGRGTLPSIERVIETYTDISKGQKECLQEPERNEAEIMRFVLREEGVSRYNYKDLLINEERNSKNTLENLNKSKNRIQGNNVALVTSPVLLLRMGTTASRLWNDKKLNLKTLITHDIDLEKYSPARRIELIGYIAGYPKRFRTDYPKIGIYNEFRGTHKEDDSIVSRDDWVLLRDLKNAHAELLECYQEQDRLEYEDASGRLILKESN